VVDLMSSGWVEESLSIPNFKVNSSAVLGKTGDDEYLFLEQGINPAPGGEHG
jgi:hypothetical protein